MWNGECESFRRCLLFSGWVPRWSPFFYERGRAISRDSLKEAKSCRASNNPTSIGKDASILGRHKVRVPFTCTPEQSVSFRS
jgi:hypothetical protein